MNPVGILEPTNLSGWPLLGEELDRWTRNWMKDTRVEVGLC